MNKTVALVYSNIQENSNKYYICEQCGMTLITKYGRLGQSPKVSKKEYTSEYVASSNLYKIIEKKKSKGYKEVSIEEIIFNEGEFFNI